MSLPKARHDRMDESVEMMLKLHAKNRTLTADSLRLAASDGESGRIRDSYPIR
ncbi:MAG: hypothetical protein NTX53_01700 [candidate division WOR-3 bacterium]|nr:hypothetical protein [candidate division WOR-3 bacterium]